MKKHLSAINKRAWAIRKRAAAKWNCPVMEINWGDCFKQAKQMEEDMRDLQKMTTAELNEIISAAQTEINNRTEEAPVIQSDIILPVNKNYVDQGIMPEYEHHKRGRNWIATVEDNPASPGGLDRDFWSKGSGSWREIPENIAVGDLLEVAGDYYTASGNKDACRGYYRIISITDGEIKLQEIESPAK